MLPNDKGGLNIVPFIDIMLVLLAIVLSISTFIASGDIKVDLPKAKHSDAIEGKKYEIVILANNEIYFEGEKITDIKSAFDGVANEDLILLKADKNAPFDSFIKVLDELKAKEHENFAIKTERR